MSRLGTITRRSFMSLGVAAAGGLAVGYYMYRKPYANPLLAMASEGDAVFNPYVRIAPGNVITIIAPRAEMGQGVHTTLAALVAEELDVSLDQIKVEHGPPAKAYFNAAMIAEGGPHPFFDESFIAEMTRGTMNVVGKFLAMQMTGGSSATIDAYVKMREAGAAARMVLLEAAAIQWDVDAASLSVSAGIITNSANGETLSYGDVAQAAAVLEPPTKIALRPRDEWKILGKSQPRVEGFEKVTGGRIFGIDVQLPDMLYGTVKMSPRFGARAISVDTSAALEVNGVLDIVPVETTTGSGFGIIAENTWAAFQGAEALDIVWGEAPYPANTEDIRAVLDKALNAKPDFEMGGKGNVEKELANTTPENVVEAVYEVPYLAHATMEPMNATAQLKDGKLELWLGTQGPGIAQGACAQLLGIEIEDVTVNTTRMGGGFGRRGEIDFSLYAAALAAKTDGRPIKVTWSREEDTQHDTYRPTAKSRFKAGISDTGEMTAMDVDIATPSIMTSLMARTYSSGPPPGPEKIMLEGALGQPLTVPNVRFRAHKADLQIPVGFWRSVGNSYNGFFHECFLDEVSEHAGKDPLAFRLAMMNDDEHRPARKALKKVAAMANWGNSLPAGKGQGIAHTLSFGAWVAQVVQVDVSDDTVKIEKVWCVADAGLVLDPENFKAQMMSGIVFGLSQALGQEITFSDGEVEQSNFYDFDAMRMHQCPEIEVELLENSPRMGGAGEPSTPPSTPALANAIFAATGQRIRSMPLSHSIEFA